MGRIRLFRRRLTWWPTRYGWLFLIVSALIPAFGIWWGGEAFLSVTDRVAADVLVVEGWIGKDALRAAAEEFRNGKYRIVVVTGGYTSRYWGSQRYSYAEIAARALRGAGVPEDCIILAQAPEVEEQRTFVSAIAARKALLERGIIPVGINVFTRGMHARRSRLVHDKLQAIPVGVIGWVPETDRHTPWWHSSERMKDFLTESCSYVFEGVLNSGRLSNNLADPVLPPIGEGPAGE